jgi:putative spermidine/putrescine transport system permease protein
MEDSDTISGWQRGWLYLAAGIIALFLITPVLIIIPMSFSDTTFLSFPPTELSLRWYEAYIGSARWLDATRVSFIVAFGTVVLATPAGTLAAYGVHTSPGRFSELIYAIVLAPLIVPVVLIGLGLFFTYAWFGLNNTYAGVILAHSMYAVPYVFVTVLSGLKNFDMNQPRVAQSLGATPIGAFFTVTVPQLKFPIITGAFLAFLASFDEVVIALYVSGGTIMTLPKLMFTELRMSLDPTITAVSTLMLLMALPVLFMSRLVNGRR